MALASIRFHPAAAPEAESAYGWYATRDSGVADAFREGLEHAVDVVARDPVTWPRHGRARRYVFPRFPFSLGLVYRLRGNDVEVLAVAHGKRRPGSWRSRL
jgi:plasmid stabilization system protein ParE